MNTPNLVIVAINLALLLSSTSCGERSADAEPRTPVVQPAVFQKAPAQRVIKDVDDDLLYGLRGLNQVGRAALLYGNAQEILNFDSVMLTEAFSQDLREAGLQPLTPQEASAVANSDPSRVPPIVTLDITSGPSIAGATIFSIDLKVIHPAALCREPDSVLGVSIYHKEGLKAVPTEAARAEIIQMASKLIEIFKSDVRAARAR